MKIEKLEISNKKVKVAFIIGFIMCALIFILINYLTSRANYRNTESIELAKGTINYSLADLNVIAMYKIEDGKDVDIDTVPTEGYTLSNRSYCTTPDSDAQIKDVFIYESGKLNIEINKKGTKCYLFFKEYNPTPSEEMLAKLNEARTKSSGKNYTIEKLEAPMGKSEEASANKLYKYPEGDDYTYIFRGYVSDNWLNFAGHTWRIIRINSDGTLRIIFSCATPSCFTTTGSGTNAVSKTAYKSSQYIDNTYVGYYYGTASSNSYDTTHKSLITHPSTIATAVKNWYNGTGAMSSYENKISGSTGFCNDRSLSTTKFSGYTGDGSGTNQSVYGAIGRLFDASWNGLSSVTPSLNCNSNDLFTYSKDPGKGNGILEVPAGLITADELALAGMIAAPSSAVTSNWLNTNQNYWTMSPAYFYTGGRARVLCVNDLGFLYYPDVSDTNGVRPVINLKANINITGAGTTDNPFVAT